MCVFLCVWRPVHPDSRGEWKGGGELGDGDVSKRPAARRTQEDASGQKL